MRVHLGRLPSGVGEARDIGWRSELPATPMRSIAVDCTPPPSETTGSMSAPPPCAAAVAPLEGGARRYELDVGSADPWMVRVPEAVQDRGAAARLQQDGPGILPGFVAVRAGFAGVAGRERGEACPRVCPLLRLVRARERQRCASDALCRRGAVTVRFHARVSFPGRDSALARPAAASGARRQGAAIAGGTRATRVNQVLGVPPKRGNRPREGAGAPSIESAHLRET